MYQQINHFSEVWVNHDRSNFQIKVEDLIWIWLGHGVVDFQLRYKLFCQREGVSHQVGCHCTTFRRSWHVVLEDTALKLGETGVLDR
jgi:hypothetical protein